MKAATSVERSAGKEEYPVTHIDSMRPNDYNPNVVKKEQFEKLRREVLFTYRSTGKIPPVIVRNCHTPPHIYEIIDGEQRYTILREAGIQQVPYMNLGDVPDAEARILTANLNWLRGDPNPHSYAKMIGQILSDKRAGLDLVALGSRLPETTQVLSQLMSTMGSTPIVVPQTNTNAPEKEESVEQNNRRDLTAVDFQIELSFKTVASVAANVEGERVRLTNLIAEYERAHKGDRQGLIRRDRVDDLFLLLATRLLRSHVDDIDDVFRLIMDKGTKP